MSFDQFVVVFTIATLLIVIFPLLRAVDKVHARCVEWRNRARGVTPYQMRRVR